MIGIQQQQNYENTMIGIPHPSTCLVQLGEGARRVYSEDDDDE